MARILFLAHRFPYPPNKGDKIRSWHFLRLLAARHEVHLVCWRDDPADKNFEFFVREQTASLKVIDTKPLLQKIRGIFGLLRGETATESAYPARQAIAHMKSLCQAGSFDFIYAFSGAMGAVALRYLNSLQADVPKPTLLLDLVDVDSLKWQAYAEKRSFPLSLLYRLEAARLGEMERRTASHSQACFLVSEEETNLFKAGFADRSAECPRVAALENGVDCDYFNPENATVLDAPEALLDASEKAGPTLAFTGVMDYAPNVEGVLWFVRACLPPLRDKYPTLRLIVAGKGAHPKIDALSKDVGIYVTGFVEDMRSILKLADVVIVPLLTARGIQNKILEALAMARPVVATQQAAEGIRPVCGDASALPMVVACDAPAFSAAIIELLEEPEQARQMGLAGRVHMQTHYSWPAKGEALEAVIQGCAQDMGVAKTGADDDVRG